MPFSVIKWKNFYIFKAFVVQTAPVKYKRKLFWKIWRLCHIIRRPSVDGGALIRNKKVINGSCWKPLRRQSVNPHAIIEGDQGLIIYGALCAFPAPHSCKNRPEAEFLDVIGTKVLRVFLLAIHSQRILLPQPPPRKSGLTLVFKGAQAWDIRLRGFCTNQTYMDRWLRN